MVDTTTPRIDDSYPGEDIYLGGAVDEAEIARLDAMHNGIKSYLDGKLFLAPLDDPRTILDIGSGSGIWAIECAEYFPNAKVTAVDVSPMLPRPIPSNFQFQQLNVLADPLPWEAGYFDVVHVRFLLIHLPEPQRAIERIAELLKPGGWLLIEDVSVNGEVNGDARAVPTAVEWVCQFWKSNGQVPTLGSKLESWLRHTGTFNEVNVHEAATAFGGSHVSADPRLGGLGLTFKNTWRGYFSGKIHPGLLARGFTPQFKEQFLEDFDTLEWQLDCPLYCLWARRST